ncbi:hypothetical protein HYS97_01715 [Candidatus Daviesbacteria bacterium]|nr:hypothetical protein [Candidatus Daviesbacteria bacterium]
MQDSYRKIIDFLNSNNISFEEIEHEAVYTSEEASKVRGMSLDGGMKSLLIKAKDEYVLAVIPGNQRLDTKKLKKVLGVNDLRFARPEEVVEVMGCEVGACYPFGNLIVVRMLIDEKLSKNELISFNPGVHTKSIKMKWKDYQTKVNPKLFDLT